MKKDFLPTFVNNKKKGFWEINLGFWERNPWTCLGLLNPEARQ